MKKKVFYPFTLLIVLLFSQCGPTIQEAVDYNDKLVAEEYTITEKINDLDEAFTTYEPANIEPALDAAKNQVDKSIKILEELGGFDGDKIFVDSYSELFKVFKSLLNNEYAEQLEIYKLSEDEYTEEKRIRYNELNKLINDKYNDASEKTSAAQEVFSEKWGFELEVRNPNN